MEFLSGGWKKMSFHLNSKLALKNNNFIANACRQFYLKTVSVGPRVCPGCLTGPLWGTSVHLWEGSFESPSSGEGTGQTQVLQTEKFQKGLEDSSKGPLGMERRCLV